ncbi:MAG TPA: hypothetical protein VGS61_00005, partial [Acidimicrobiales bacterium]|nr:hypothetical protein [Acidimicrobiales bacterium]
MSAESTPLVDLGAYGAWLFDVDGVLTQTATVHATAWKMAFDSFLAAEGARTGTPYAPFDEVNDFENYVNGMPREDGVRDFLSSRGITLPEGAPDDPPGARTVNGVADAKNEHFQTVIASQGIVAFDGAVRLVRDLRGR